MYHYTTLQWLLFFYCYCVFGWCFESTYVSIKTRKLTNRGFMRGPWLPIYGTGAIVMLFCANPFSNSLILTFLAGMIGASALEFVTGMVMEALFKVRYWDYSDRKFNIMGHVCLFNSCAWGACTVFLTRFLHKFASGIILLLPSFVIRPFVIVWTVVIAMDFALSFKAALDIRDILVQMERAKEEMQRIQKRLDVLIAVTSDEIVDKKDQTIEKVEFLMEYIEDALLKAKEKLFTQGNEINAEVRHEVEDLSMNYVKIKDRRFHLSSLRDFFQRSILRDNPSMVSHDYPEGLESLKENVRKSS